jgi:hypothetical protein
MGRKRWRLALVAFCGFALSAVGVTGVVSAATAHDAVGTGLVVNSVVVHTRVVSPVVVNTVPSDPCRAPGVVNARRAATCERFRARHR